MAPPLAPCRSGGESQRGDLGSGEPVVRRDLAGRLAAPQPSENGVHRYAPAVYGRPAAVDPGIDGDVDPTVAGQVDQADPAVAVVDAGQVVADRRPEHLLTTADHDQAVDRLPRVGIPGAAAKS